MARTRAWTSHQARVLFWSGLCLCQLSRDASISPLFEHTRVGATPPKIAPGESGRTDDQPEREQRAC